MKILFAIALSLLLLTAPSTKAGEREDALATIVKNYQPGLTNFPNIKVKDVNINDSKKTITIQFGENASYLSLTPEKLETLKAECKEVFGSQYSKYKVVLRSEGANMDSLALYAPKKLNGPKEKESFIVYEDFPGAPDGLDGANIAMWQSHGWYFEPKLNRWEWQRARIFQTVEDIYTQSYVMPYLMPMLENAGAYVLSPRERDTQRIEIIADNDDSKLNQGTFKESGAWKVAGKDAFGNVNAELHNGDNPFKSGTALQTNLSGTDKATATARWQAAIPKDGDYAVYVSYASLPNSTPSAIYSVTAANGVHNISINQKMGGGTWVYLGHYPFKASKDVQTIVTLTNKGKNKKQVVTADAVKIGGGMGNVARIVKEPVDSIDYQYVLSGYPRFTEGARYFLQWAGAPDSVFTPSDYVNDYTDDYKSRGLWVNWLAGGSSVLPKRDGLKIPIDLSFAFHSDAGTTLNDSIIGTLGIYCTAGNKFANGNDRMASRDLTDEIMTSITEDIRGTFEPNWTRRGMWDKSYFEARVPEVPAMLLELLSHQNLADMSYGLDPEFHFVVSRAIYKGMLRFLAHRDGRPYVVQPLPVHAFAIEAEGSGKYKLSWQATEDKFESTANPSYYIIESRTNDGAFTFLARSETPEFEVNISDTDIHSYRIIAGNSGGISFPSEVLALCDMPGKEAVTIVNGFTRVSAPDRFDSGEIAGFYDARDHGVPYIKDISYIGSQFEFRREIPWMDDDAAGFGASRANYEDKVVAGNTFDYVYVHGQAIRQAGFPFVSTSVEAFCNSDVKAKNVDLILGKQKEIKQGRGAYGTRFKTFPGELQTRLAALTTAGCNVFVSGAYVATDLWDNPYSDEATAKADQEFATKVLGYHWRVGQASVTGQAYQVATRFKAFGSGEYDFHAELNEECYAVESPDSFYAANKETGATFVRYSENNLVAGTAMSKPEYRTVVIGFPFETIKGQESRSHLMKQVLNFFTQP